MTSLFPECAHYLNAYLCINPLCIEAEQTQCIGGTAVTIRQLPERDGDEETIWYNLACPTEEEGTWPHEPLDLSGTRCACYQYEIPNHSELAKFSHSQVQHTLVLLNNSSVLQSLCAPQASSLYTVTPVVTVLR